MSPKKGSTIPKDEDHKVVTKEYMGSEADIILVSTDDIHFPVHSYYLKAASPFFRDMLSNPNLKESPIPMDAASGDLSLFLDYICNAPVDHVSNWPQFKKIIELCQKYSCDSMIDRFRIRARDAISAAPWEVFCIASFWKDVKLAQEAIRYFGSDFSTALIRPHLLPLAFAQSCDLGYLLGLFRAMIPPGGYYYTQHTPEWDAVAEKFAAA
ncbi:hypothetical protein IAR55_006180 [Kwoniella newhampshirensis]|uniref:BTB domain-containing protein n=1 Tax=Kwoniella newhampshirensis TaxID=1651941 RepID=A0AAW0YU39_9TREE